MSSVHQVVREQLTDLKMRRPAQNHKIAKIATNLFLEHAREALDTLVEVMRDEHAKPSEKVAAAKEILDRGMGKAVSRVDMQVNHQHEHVISPEALKNLSDDDLQKAISIWQNLQAPDVIDVTPED